PGGGAWRLETCGASDGETGRGIEPSGEEHDRARRHQKGGPWIVWRIAQGMSQRQSPPSGVAVTRSTSEAWIALTGGNPPSPSNTAGPPARAASDPANVSAMSTGQPHWVPVTASARVLNTKPP